MFDPVPGEGPIGPSAVGYFGADGRYTLTLPGEKKGAHVGEYRVMILSAVKEEFGEEEAATTRKPSRINVRYEDIKHSGLTATVVPGDNVIDFEYKDRHQREVAKKLRGFGMFRSLKSTKPKQESPKHLARMNDYRRILRNLPIKYTRVSKMILSEKLEDYQELILHLLMTIFL